MKHFLLLFTFFAFTASSYGEGTKQLRPAENSYGSLHLNNSSRITGTTVPMYTSFGMYNAPESQQIKIRINSTDEIIYYGLNNKQGNGGTNFMPNVPYRIKDPAGNIVVDNVTMPAAGQEGHIATWSAAVAGPRELGNPAGYDALEYIPAMTGDYVIEFNPSSNMDIHLFDITVANAAMEPQPGRLHSQGWQISTENGNNPFSGKVYPYDPRGVIYEVDFNDMQPFTFVVNFNSRGTGTTGNYLEDRKSKIGRSNYSIPEFEVFLNPPDETSFPTFVQEGNFSGIAVFSTCAENSYCLNYTSDVAGILDGYIDINKNNIYDPELDILFTQEFIKDTTICVPWDGKDVQGNIVNPEDVQILASFGLSVTHLPVFDAEHNTGGLIVKTISPQGLPEPLIYWDDSNINDTRNIDEKVNLTGCSSLGGGCHKWRNRGDNSNPETINTWWYTKVLFDTITLSAIYNPQVSLSFNEHSISRPDTSLCTGDSIRIYIHNDGEHFNDVLFNYSWSVNETEVPVLNGRELKEHITGNTQISIISSLISDPTCLTYDTMFVTPVNPVEITATVADEDCSGNSGSITIQIIDGPPGAELIWDDIALNVPIRDNLSAGTYSLLITHPDYSSLCALDTFFTINQANPIRIERLELTPSDCFRANGSAEVEMNDPALTYAYSWSGSALDDASVSNLNAGTHTVTITESVSGCTVDSSFTIPALPFEIDLAVNEDTCGLAEGSIILTTPGKDFFTLMLNGAIHTDTSYKNLLYGSYHLSVISLLDNMCMIDTNVTVANQSITPDPDIVLSPVVCGLPTGSATVTMPSDGRYYRFSWFGEAWTDDTFRDNLSKNSYLLSVEIAGTTCRLDTGFTIDGSDAIAIERLLLENTPCYEASGKAEVVMQNMLKVYSYQWDNRPATSAPVQNNLSEGGHQVTVTETATGCTADSVFTIVADPFAIDISQTNELCGGSNATVQLEVPESSFTIYWNHIPSARLQQSGLSAGNLSIRVVSDYAATCFKDTAITIINEDRPVVIDGIYATDSDCQQYNGSIELVMPSANYEYSINHGGYTASGSFTGLTPGHYFIRIREINTTCQKDTSISISTKPFTVEAEVQADLCASGKGSIIIPIYTSDVEVLWQDGMTGPVRTPVSEGSYAVRIQNKNIPNCVVDTLIEVPGYTYTVQADFSYSSDYALHTDFPVDFFNTSQGVIAASRWNFGDNQESSATNPSHIYTEEGDYQITLYVKDTFGCEGITSRWLSIKKYIPCEVALPNAFSPNNDQFNDDIGLLGFAHKVDLIVFNRWGEVIFRSGDFEERWDGTFLQVESPVGVYPYVLEYECEDFAGKRVKNKTIGEITLIR